MKILYSICQVTPYHAARIKKLQKELSSDFNLEILELFKSSNKYIFDQNYEKIINSNILNDSELENVKGILSFMVSKNDTSYLEQFKKYNQALDESREESFEQIFPEYESWYKTI